MNIDDFARVVGVSDPRISPDGRRVVFVRTHTDLEKNRYRSALWVTTVDGEAARAFTNGEWSDSGPQWSPDGRWIAFTSDRQKPKSQVYLIPADGGEPKALTSLPEGKVQAIRWSPDGTSLAFLFRETPEAYTKQAVEDRKKDELPNPPRLHTRLNYRLDGFGYFDDSYWQVWTADVAAGAARAVTAGPFNCGAPSWSPDGSRLAFLSNRREDADLEGGRDDLWTVAFEGGEPNRVPAPPGSKGNLVWSPDGRWLAYAGNPDPEDQWGTKNTRLFVLPAAGSNAAADLTGHTDISLGYLTLSDVSGSEGANLLKWSGDSQQLFYAASSFGDTRLFSVPVGGGDPAPLTAADAVVGGFDVSTDGRTVALAMSCPTCPTELFLGTRSETSGLLKLRQVTDFNREWRQNAAILAPEPVEIRSPDGADVHGWLLKDPAKVGRLPLVLYIHGGPHLQYGNTLFHELQWLAAEGFAVLYMNPRGSKGYGEAHTSAIRGSWGDRDYEDLMAAVDWAAARDDVDPNRMAVMGGSYGGFMTAWVIGHTNRFRCAIADRLVGNLHSMSGVVDFTWRHGSYFPGNAWDDPAVLWKHSPLAYAGKIQTPLLLIHSDGDLRCDIGQAEELFAALRQQRKAVEFVRYPAETSHGLSRNGPPNLRLDRLRRNLEWLRRWM